ncbi:MULTISPECIES: DUF1275 domain-containing protein [unclassified Microbacterium]|uniref:DUF1275 domain-containing protein n=1 Tax=unclassified Microbacterium TaxID=2609290 RepID=UPI00214C9D91|nr:MULTISPECIES: DUF1275 domain-containing protein [unclassified Microbacterium]MCR2809916.1 DUF1275 domain-containing protein [Microbacterium sp. zg.B185]WIM17778.1 DUF1275 domain-containing protein [Microbacterium sp. zg-B185]
MATERVASVDARRVRRVHAVLVLLSFSAGAADAFAFLALGGIFTANMTGNLVLIGMFSRPEFAQTLVTALIAIVSFVGVLYAAFRLTVPTGALPVTQRHTLRRLVLPSLVLQTLVVAIWAALRGDVGMVERCIVISLSAAALALQTVAAKKLSDIEGVTTTYVTGTLTTTMHDLAVRSAHGQGLRVLSVVALPVGAVSATAALLLAAELCPVVAWLPAVAAAILLLSTSRP